MNDPDLRIEKKRETAGTTISLSVTNPDGFNQDQVCFPVKGFKRLLGRNVFQCINQEIPEQLNGFNVHFFIRGMRITDGRAK